MNCPGCKVRRAVEDFYYRDSPAVRFPTCAGCRGGTCRPTPLQPLPPKPVRLRKRVVSPLQRMTHDHHMSAWDGYVTAIEPRARLRYSSHAPGQRHSEIERHFLGSWLALGMSGVGSILVIQNSLSGRTGNSFRRTSADAPFWWMQSMSRPRRGEERPEEWLRPGPT